MTIDPKLNTTELFEAIVESSLDLITIVDEQGNIAYQSPSISMFGFSQGEQAGAQVINRVHPDDRERINGALQRILKPTDVVERHELRLLHKDGSYSHAEVVAKHFEQGDFRGALISTRDITAKYRMLQQLERSNRLFSTIFSVSRNILSISSAESGVFIDVNDEWLSTFGYEKHEVIGRSAVDLNIWGGRAAREKIIADLQKADRLQNYEATAVTKSGDVRNLIVDATYIEVLGENRLLFSATDVTERLVMEDQLRQSQKMEAIGQLTGGIAHDFNNLLSVVSGNAELIAEFSDENPQIKGLVDAVLKATDRGAALTQQLLAFSRRQALSPRTVYLDKLILEMQPMLERTLGANIEFEINSPNDLWPCFADPLQTENAILNIALNSRDAMASSSGKLTISTTNRTIYETSLGSDAGEYVEIKFVDNGKGIPAGMLDHVFEPFFTTKETGKGTGLGLSMVFGFVKQSGGHIDISSDKYVGTEITILLPKSESTVATPDAGSNQLTPGMGERILLLEDNIDLQQVTKRNLEQLGYKVATAASEAEVDRLVVLESFDLLITDVMLPGSHNGKEIATRLQQDYPLLKVLLISGYAKGVTDETASTESATRLLPKPFTRGQLSAAIREVLAD